MAYQLRRIIAINIKNPATGTSSGRIAELDPRGGVLAIGPNGVGKTSFLRLLPLFYGATTSQVLRGTGRDSIIQYLMPDPGSCVVYEYERENESDLRCVVMHCQDNVDAPEFRIIRGGFREDYFVDENNQFVLRDEYPSRVEQIAIREGWPELKITRKLSLSQYRSVILNERVLTKDAQELRRLAAEHALSTTPLTNLEQLAAAMANEKINFRDLQNIVIERVSDARGAAGVANRRELRKGRNDVSAWLKAHEHMEAVMKAKPQANGIKAGVTTIRDLHLKMSALRVATKEARVKADEETAEKKNARQKLIDDSADSEETQSTHITELSDSMHGLTEAANKAAKRVADAESKIAYYKRINIEALAAQQDGESSVSRRLEAAEIDLDRLEKDAGKLAERRNKMEQGINQSLNIAIGEVNDQRREKANELQPTLLALESCQREQEEAVDANSPKRIGEIESEISALNVRVGELSSAASRPVASEKSQKVLLDAEAEFGRLRDTQTGLLTNQVNANAEQSLAKSAADQAFAKLQVQGHLVDEIAGELESLKSKLNPPAGSLLEFLRKNDPAAWADAAKIISPELLHRLDLSPLLTESQVGSDHRIEAANVSLVISGVQAPPWVSMDDGQIEAKQAQLASASQAKSSAETEAKKCSDRFADAKERSEQIGAQVSLVSDACKNAKGNVERAKAVVEQEKAGAANSDRQEAGKVSDRINDLTREREELRRQQLDRKSSIRASFADLKRQANDAHTQVMGQLDEQEKRLREAAAGRLAELNADIDRELLGLGVDPDRLNSLREEVSELQGIKLNISRNRQEVDQWREFSAKDLPNLALWIQQRDSAAELLSAREDEIRKKQTQLDLWKNEVRRQINEFDRRIERLAVEAEMLDEVLKGPLVNSDAYVAAKLDVEWTAENLAKLAGDLHRDFVKANEDLTSKVRALRNIMLSQDGAVQQWLALKERDLPDQQTLHEHEMLCAKASILSDWYNSTEYGPYIDSLNKEMMGFMGLASTFVADLDGFETRISRFNKELQAALRKTATFERFKDLSVLVRSGISKLDYMDVLREMGDIARSQQSSLRAFVVQDTQLPPSERVNLIRRFMDALPFDGRIQVNLNEHVQLECSLVENGQVKRVASQEDFLGVSSTGNTALIIAMFLMGFVQMIRGEGSPVHLTWVRDEVGLFDGANMASFMQTLAQHNIDVIGATPSVVPAHVGHFARLSFFESSGAIKTLKMEEVSHGKA